MAGRFDADLALAQVWIPAPLELTSGLGSLRLWLELNGTRLGAATADAAYGAGAGFGLTLISSVLVNQQTWLRQLVSPVTAEMEDSLLRTIARTNGIPFPATATLASRWLRGRLRRPAPVESTYCAEVVAGTYQAMGLLAEDRPTNYYDPGKFWSGDALQLVGDARLGAEIRVEVPT